MVARARTLLISLSQGKALAAKPWPAGDGSRGRAAGWQLSVPRRAGIISSLARAGPGRGNYLCPEARGLAWARAAIKPGRDSNRRQTQKRLRGSVMIKDSDGRVMMSDDPGIWKPIPVRTFYTFVIYYGYDMDILSGKSYDVVYLDYTLQMICISQMQIIYNGISLSYIFLLLEKYFKISYTEDIQITNILECHMYGISKSQIFLNVICMGCLNHKYLYQGYSMDMIQDILFQASAALGALQRLRALVAMALFAPSCAMKPTYRMGVGEG